jgi:fucose permease
LVAYALDVFPDTAVQASALLNIFRTTGGFIVNYFQVQWAEKNGAAVSFGTQGAVVVAAWALIVIVQIFGKKWREMWRARHPQRASVEL